MPDNTEFLVPCPLCYEPIHPKARVCKHCKGDLTWRRYVTISSTTLALLTALIAVAGTVGPNVKKLFIPNAAKLSVILIGSDASSVRLLITNSGGVATTVSSANLLRRTSENVHLIARFDADPPTVIDPTSSSTHKFKVSNEKYEVNGDGVSQKDDDITQAMKFARKLQDRFRANKTEGNVCVVSVIGTDTKGESFEFENGTQECGDASFNYTEGARVRLSAKR